MGKFLSLLIVLSAVAAGVGIWYSNQVAYWGDADIDSIELTTPSGDEVKIAADNIAAITADTSPLRFRACFQTPETPASLRDRYTAAEDAVPTNAPVSFDCFDAASIGAMLEDGTAHAFLGTENVLYGIDRIVAVADDGRGWAWHQINACGEVVFDGKPAPEGCPPRE